LAQGLLSWLTQPSLVVKFAADFFAPLRRKAKAMKAVDPFSHPPPSGPSGGKSEIQALREPWPEDSLTTFSGEMEEALAKLEKRFSNFTTRGAVLRSLNRRTRT
jgi:hypothetical protein